MNFFSSFVTCENCESSIYQNTTTPLSRCPKCKHPLPQLSPTKELNFFLIFILVVFIGIISFFIHFFSGNFWS
jgi:Zn finger protein HypA/HybF involved in hydrogenase expression